MGFLRRKGYDLVDFGAISLNDDDDYPDFVVPLALAVGAGEVERGRRHLRQRSGGLPSRSNKVAGARASLIHDGFSAHQGVEDDNMNVLCLGGRVIGDSLAEELVLTFLDARFSSADRHRRRLAKVTALEKAQ